MPASLAHRLRLALGAALLLGAPLVSPLGAHDAPGEYFFGEDPGIGDATPLPFSAAPAPALADIHELSLPLPDSPGAGLVLGLRFRNASGRWGGTTFRTVYLLDAVSPVRVEWAWGANFPAATTDTAAVVDGTFTLPRPATLPEGAKPNHLALRARSGGLAGPASFRPVSSLEGTAPARLFYAVDRNPVPATDPFVALNAEHTGSPVAVPLDLGAITSGFHALHLQLLDAKGLGTRAIRYLHVKPSTVQTLAGLAYAFRNGEGGVSTIQVAPITLSPASQEITLPIPALVAPGDYTLVLNLADSASNLGFSHSAPLRVGTLYDIWATTTLAGRPPGDTAMLADPDGDQIVNLLELAFGLDPLQPEDTPPWTITPADTGSTRIDVRYRQREGGAGELGVDYAAEGIRYIIEASTDLQTWHPFIDLPGIGYHSSRDSHGDGIETVSFELFPDAALNLSQKVFFRLNISLLP